MKYKISYTFQNFAALAIPKNPTNPCLPSPCGPNSLCQIGNDGESYSCACELGSIGSPPNCRPECINNDECSLSQSCMNKKCIDPCPGSCGSNAECRVTNHIPSCTCIDTYFGDPFVECVRKQCKNFKQTVRIVS